MLAIAIRLGVRAWINPLLAGLGVWLTYLLGKRIFSDFVGLLAAGLTVTSPFFLMNSGSLLSHPFGLVLSSLFALGWLESFWDDKSDNRSMEDLARVQKTMGVHNYFSSGARGLDPHPPNDSPGSGSTIWHPWAIPDCSAVMLKARLRLLVFGLMAILFVGLYLLWQYSLTGNALLNPYTLWWPYDKVGFGPGHGRMDQVVIP